MPQISPPVLIAAMLSDRRWLPPPTPRPDRPRRPTLPRTRHHRQSTHGHRAPSRVVRSRAQAPRVVRSRAQGLCGLGPRLLGLCGLGPRLLGLCGLGPRLLGLCGLGPRLLGLCGLGPRLLGLCGLGPRLLGLCGLGPRLLSSGCAVSGPGSSGWGCWGCGSSGWGSSGPGSSTSGTLESESADDSGPSTSCDGVGVAAGSSAGASRTAGSIGGAEVDGGGDESGSGTGSTVVSSAAGRAAANPVSGRGAVRGAMAATAAVEAVPGSRAPARSPVKCRPPLLGTASLAHEEVRKKSATHTPMPTARRWGRGGRVDMVALEPNSFVRRCRANPECALGWQGLAEAAATRQCAVASILEWARRCRTRAGQWSVGCLVAADPGAENPAVSSGARRSWPCLGRRPRTWFRGRWCCRRPRGR